MRIAFDARKLRDYGIGTYIRGLLPELWRLAGDPVEWILLVHPWDLHSRLFTGPFPSRLHWIPVRASTYAPSAHWELTRVLKSVQPDLFHMPHFPLPFFLKIRAVVTIHDTILLRRWAGDRRWWLPHVARWLMAGTLRKAAAVLTVSHTVAEQIRKEFPFVRGKTFPVWNGLHPIFQDPNRLGTRPVRLPELPDQPYFLYVGNLKPHKNLARLLAAWESNLSGDGKRPLVLAGLPLAAREKLQHAYARHIADGQLILLPWLDDAQLVSVFTGARALIHPSLAEGFGLTLLEAMATGVPVACSDIAVHHEIADLAALYFNPYNPVDIARAMRQIDADETLRQELIQRGRENLRRFSWRNAAQAVWALYQNVING